MKNVLIFLLGAGCGALATFFFVKDKAEKQAQEDVDNMRAMFEKQYGVAPTSPAEAEGEALDPPMESEEAPKKVVTAEEISSNPNKTRDYSRYSKVKDKIIKTIHSEEDREAYDDRMDELKVIRKGRKGDMYEPVIIDEEEYNILLDSQEWDAMEVEYSPTARFGAYFVDSSGNEINMDSIGTEVEDYFKTQADEDEVVYVKNEELQMIFMVTMEVPPMD